MDEEYLTPLEVDFIKHALGLDNSPKIAYRNYYSGKSEIGDSLDKKGFVHTWKVETNDYLYYKITEAGINILKDYIGSFKIAD